MADSARPELCSCPGPDEFTYLNQEPRLALLLGLVPDSSKLIPSNVEKLTLHTNSLAEFLAKAHLSWPHFSRLGGKEQKKWRFVHLGIFHFRGVPCKDHDQPSPQENVSQCSEPQGWKASRVPALFLLLGLGAPAGKPESWVQIPSLPLGFLNCS